MRNLNQGIVSGINGLVFSAVLCVASTVQATLVGHWAMDEASWSGAVGDVKDSSSTGNHGQSFFDANTVPGRIGRAGAFDGTSDRVIIPNSASHDLQSDATIAVWAQFNSVPAGTHTVVGSNSYTPGFLFNQLGDRMSFYYKSNGPVISTPAASLSTGTWYHFAMTNTAGAMNLYVNGTLLGSPSEGVNAFSSGPWNIGGGQFPSTDGIIDDFAVWSDGMSPAKARSLYTVVEDLGLDYNASNLDFLWQTYDAMGSGTVNGTNWNYTASLPGSPAPGDAYQDGLFYYIALGASDGLFAAVPVPEPSSVMLLGLGMLGFIRCSRRRRKA